MSTENTKKIGKKRKRNEPILHDELKTSRHLFLTPTAWEKLKAYAKKQEVSISELVETWARNIEAQ
ncbi:MAG: hypothetical protein PUP93_21685 [Rhizonema sp. NSF051]|nr:hypothetical protein [Rhizonema sp. NSF051]